MGVARKLRRALEALAPQDAPRAIIEPPPIVRLAEDPLRCRCPECLMLDALFPGDGYQLALFPYAITVRRN